MVVVPLLPAFAGPPANRFRVRHAPGRRIGVVLTPRKPQGQAPILSSGKIPGHRRPRGGGICRNRFVSQCNFFSDQSGARLRLFPIPGPARLPGRAGQYSDEARCQPARRIGRTRATGRASLPLRSRRRRSRASSRGSSRHSGPETAESVPPRLREPRAPLRPIARDGTKNSRGRGGDPSRASCALRQGTRPRCGERRAPGMNLPIGPDWRGPAARELKDCGRSPVAGRAGTRRAFRFARDSLSAPAQDRRLRDDRGAPSIEPVGSRLRNTRPYPRAASAARKPLGTVAKL